MKIKHALPILFIPAIALLISCEPEPEKYGDCVWDTTGRDCGPFSFSIVDAETY